jgi:hypothetical protein
VLWKRNWSFAQGITHSFARIGNAVTPPLVALLVELVSWRGSLAALAVEPRLGVVFSRRSGRHRAELRGARDPTEASRFRTGVMD